MHLCDQIKYCYRLDSFNWLQTYTHESLQMSTWQSSLILAPLSHVDWLLTLMLHDSMISNDLESFIIFYHKLSLSHKSTDFIFLVTNIYVANNIYIPCQCIPLPEIRIPISPFLWQKFQKGNTYIKLCIRQSVSREILAPFLIVLLFCRFASNIWSK